MTRIDFYFNVEDKFSQVARLAEMALPRERRLHIFIDGAASATRLESALWSQTHRLGRKGINAR